SYIALQRRLSNLGRAMPGGQPIRITQRFSMVKLESPPVFRLKPSATGNPDHGLETAGFGARVQANQRMLSADLKSSYDFIVCGSGSSGSVVARRLAESGDASVLLIEAGGTDDVPGVREARQWLTNFGTERHWNFQAEPNPLLNRRRLPLNTGKVL